MVNKMATIQLLSLNGTELSIEFTEFRKSDKINNDLKILSVTCDFVSKTLDCYTRGSWIESFRNLYLLLLNSMASEKSVWEKKVFMNTFHTYFRGRQQPVDQWKE